MASTSPEGSSTSPVCHPSPGHKHVINTLKNTVMHDSLFLIIIINTNEKYNMSFILSFYCF